MKDWGEREFQDGLKAIWAELAEREGYARPKMFRKLIENEYGFEDRDQGDLDDFAEWLPERLEKVDALVRAANVANRNRRQPETETEGSTPKRLDERHQEMFEKRKQIVGFVAMNWLTIDHIVKRSFSPRRRVKWGEWERMCQEWNRAHPDEPMAKESLRTKFALAMKDSTVRERYFDGLEDLLSESVKEVAESTYERVGGADRESELPEVLRQRLAAWRENLERLRRQYPYEDRELKLADIEREDPKSYGKILRVLGQCHKRYKRLLKECYRDGRGRCWYELTSKEKAALESAYDDYSRMVDSFETADSRIMKEKGIRIPFSRPTIESDDVDAIMEVLKEQGQSGAA